MTGAVALRPYRPADYDVVRRWIDDPIIDGGFPSEAPMHDDAEVRAIVHDEARPNLDRFAVVVDDRVVGEAQVRHSSPVFPDRVFGLGIAIFDPADRGRGFGRGAAAADGPPFRDREARRVQAETDPHNVRSAARSRRSGSSTRACCVGTSTGMASSATS